MPAKTSLVRNPEADRETRRCAIIATAAKLFAELGYSTCEMDRLATKLKIAKGTLYLYFSSKEELFCACVDDGMERLQVELRAAADGQEDPLEKIAAGIFAYLKFFDEHSHYAELLIQERAIFRNRKRPSYFEHRDSNRGVWRDIYRDLIAVERVRGDLPIERIMDTVGNLLYGSMFTNHFIGKSTSLADQFHAIWQIVMTGLMTDAERAATLKKTRGRK
ncbi:HTH-type transcriptional repressor KstR2 [Anatilimnocola aggregata]|uniref:HTH-type transcriptional repressor KstR2 n=1 Tax=Anatilimnocola aggregata TaxID=2528021 RepID=A0A517YHS1_9BACT|nr:TetR/AcrR family transcriptional regulator [Anatilimnocola aggregata]QDU29766.1 HTH-type transcriptional repressor KstR2 [Anatilimnocola aggregata]